MTAPEQVTYTLSSMPPLTAIFGVQPATLLVGLEDDVDGSLKAYLGARWKRTFVRITEPTDQDAFRRAWGSMSSHIWLSPIPPAELLEQDPPTPEETHV